MAIQGIVELKIHLTLLFKAISDVELLDNYQDFCNYLDAAIQDSETLLLSESKL